MNLEKMNRELLQEINHLKNQNITLSKKNKELTKQLRIGSVSCSFADEEILSNSLRFALEETPRDKQGALNDFKKYQALMRMCMKWLKDNYKPPCDGFLNGCEA